MKRVLVFWLWFQWKKYVNYFKSKWFIVDWVNKSWLTDLKLNLFSFDEIKKKDKSFFFEYEYVIVCIKPTFEQDNVINLLIELELENKIIIEKPVTNDLLMFKKLLNLESVSFFLDEIVLWNIFKQQEIKDVVISLPNWDIDMLEHIMGVFILNKDFINILKEIKIKNFNCADYKKLIYKITFWKYTIICERWEYFINGKRLNFSFDKSLDFLLNSIIKNQNMLQLFKKNFFLLKSNR